MSDKDKPGRPPLRLIKTPKPKPRYYEPDPEVKEMFDDIRRQQAEREQHDPEGKNVA